MVSKFVLSTKIEGKLNQVISGYKLNEKNRWGGVLGPRTGQDQSCRGVDSEAPRDGRILDLIDDG